MPLGFNGKHSHIWNFSFYVSSKIDGWWIINQLSMLPQGKEGGRKESVNENVTDVYVVAMLV